MSPSVTVLDVCGFVIILNFSFRIGQKAPRRRLHDFTGICGAGQLVLTLSDSLHCRCEEFSFTVSFIGHPKMTASYYHKCINSCCELLGPSSITILLQLVGERGPDSWECIELRAKFTMGLDVSTSTFLSKCATQTAKTCSLSTRILYISSFCLQRRILICMQMRNVIDVGKFSL